MAIDPNEQRTEFDEKGGLGINAYAGFVRMAYTEELYIPKGIKLLSRLRRSDPETTIVRLFFGALSQQLESEWTIPDDANDKEKEAGEFAASVMGDVEGGESSLHGTALAYLPFFGWTDWEVLPGLRQYEWRVPNDPDDTWQSEYNDNLIGIRRFAFRDPTSFYMWEMNEKGRLKGLWQFPQFGKSPVLIPIESLLHLTFGDTDNPEGLTPQEALYRLERLKYGYEVVMGIGTEHSAGYFGVTTEGKITPADEAIIRKAARAVASAAEGNYVAFPQGITGELKDVPFSAGTTVLETIRYYSIMKLMIWGMQYVAMSSISGSGSYSAVNDSSSMAITMFNAITEGIEKQIDAQVGRRLFEYAPNKAYFGDIRRPHYTIKPIQKNIELGELGQFLNTLWNKIDLGEEDIKAIRLRSGFLSETLPEKDLTKQPPAPIIKTVDPDAEPTPEEKAGETQKALNEASRFSLFSMFRGRK